VNTLASQPYVPNTPVRIDRHGRAQRISLFVLHCAASKIMCCMGTRHAEKRLRAHCYLCGQEFTREREGGLDHVVPRSRGGTAADNLRPCCRTCNRLKGTRTLQSLYEMCENVVFELGRTELPYPSKVRCRPILDHLDGHSDSCTAYEPPRRSVFDSEGMPTTTWMRHGRAARSNRRQILARLLNDLHKVSQ
jgi:hypothetical protein